MFYDFINRYGLYIGLSFSALVLILLGYGHLVAEAETPLSEPFDDAPKVGLCHDAPAYAVDELPEIIALGRGVNLDPEQVWFQRLDCDTLRTFDEGRRSTYYSEGWILITLRDQWFSDDHVGETVRWTTKDAAGNTLTIGATIMLPETVDLKRSADPDDTERVPENVERLALGHEYLHAWGFDHTSTPLFWLFSMEKSGHLMTESIWDAGWSLEGVQFPGQ